MEDREQVQCPLKRGRACSWSSGYTSTFKDRGFALTRVFAIHDFNSNDQCMLVLWIMVGLTIIAVISLILTLKISRRTRAERERLDAKTTADKEAIFQKNCLAFNLSIREIEVLRLILAGHTYKSAAEILFISEKTIDAHLRSIYSKTGVKNKVELIVKFYS